MKSTITLLFALLIVANAHAQITPQADSTDKEIPWVYVEEMPVSSVNVAEYIAKNVVYPNSAYRKGITGRVIIKFVVMENGEIDSARVLKGFDKKCDKEALRVVAGMPKWKPGTQNGKAVKVYYTLPIDFRLEDYAPSLGTRPKKGLRH